MTKSPPRRGTETSATRARLLDVTEQIMLADGYAAVSSRRVAKEADVTAALVHYYFGTLDELFLAVLKRRAEQQRDRQRQILSESERPLRAFWEASRDLSRTGLVLEFALLANHRKVVQSEMARYAEQFRELQLEALGAHIERCGIDPDAVPPVAVLFLINAVAQTWVLEQSIGMTLGHAEADALIERCLDQLEGTADHPTTPRAER